MEAGNLSNMSATSPPAATGFASCSEYKANLTAGLRPYQILVFLNPVDSRIWTERNDGWREAFKVYIGLLGSVYLMLGLFSLVLLIKKDCVRLATKTFFAVYTTITILGFSRALLLALDPYDLLGFISDSFPPWIIITRILGSFGFPSLVASYTLMVFTLLKIAKANPGKQWYHKWRYVIPIVVSPYVIAIGAEVIGYLAEYPGLLSVIICEMTFALWGTTVCITYLIAGSRLMHQLRKRERNTVRMSGSSIATNSTSSEHAHHKDFATEEYERHHRHNRRTARKIAIITYGTVFVAFFYSLLTFGNIIMVSLFIFQDCLGFMGARGNSILWLILHVTTRISEIVLAVIMLYSITDVSGVVRMMSRMFSAMFCCKKMRVTECSKQNRPNPLTGTLYTSPSKMNMISQSPTQPSTPNTASTICSPHHREEEINTERVTTIALSDSGDLAIQIEATDIEQRNYPSTAVDGTLMNNPRSFLLNASSGESSSSIESTAQPVKSQPTVVAPKPEENSQTPTSSEQHAEQLQVVVQIESEPTERHTQAELSTDSREDLDVLSADSNSNLIDSTSPVHVLKYAQTVPVEESEIQGVERGEDTGQAKAAAGVNKPVPKPRKFAPKSRERRERLREQKQLPLTSVSSLRSKLKRKQTV